MRRKIRNFRKALAKHGPASTVKLTTRSLKRSWYQVKLPILKRFNPESVRTLYGIRLASNWGDCTFRWCVMASYDHTLEKILESQKTPFTFLDIGANQGLFSLLAARNPHCERVIAFEPVDSVHELLTDSIRFNRATKITAIKRAISDTDGFLKITKKQDHSGTANLRGNTEHDSETETEIIESVSAKGLDDIIPSSDRYVVKIDVEGHEETVIRELMKFRFASQIDQIFYEVDEQWINPEEIQALLSEHQFNTFQRHGKMERHYDVHASR